MKKRKNRAKIAFFCLFLIIFASACSPKPESSENTDYFIRDGAIYKLEPELRPEQVQLAADKINAQISAHPEMENIFVSIIPDKSYFVAAENGYPSMDYMEMVDIILENVETSEYIDLFGALKAGDYYRTDSHWRQESIIPVAQALCAAMGAAAPDEKDFVSAYIGDFQGVYSGLSGLSAEDDEMLVLESEATKSAIVTSAELEGALPVYAPEKFSGKEPYDVFLHGAQAVLTIENPDAAEKKELIIFRDSFGSSLAPLLIGSYSKITLVDLRYIMGDYVSEFVAFEGADVLFIYSTTLLNSGGILR